MGGHTTMQRERPTCGPGGHRAGAGRERWKGGPSPRSMSSGDDETGDSVRGQLGMGLRQFKAF